MWGIMDNNNIIFLGTAGDSIIYGKQYRSSGGIIFKLSGIQLHLDPGPGALVRASQFKINIRETTGILISSPSVLRSNDINALIGGMTYDGLDHKGVVVGLFLSIQDSENSSIIRSESFSFVEKVISLKPDQKVGINNIDILAKKSFGDLNSINFKIYSPEFVIGYISESIYDSKLIEDFSDVDILIVNCKNPESVKSSKSLNTLDVIKLVEGIKPSLTVITGFGIKMLESDPIIEARKIQKTTGHQTIAAKDGLVLNPGSYATKSRQSRLGNF